MRAADADALPGRNAEYIGLAIKYTLSLSADRRRLKKLPRLLKGSVSVNHSLYSPSDARTRRIAGTLTSEARTTTQKAVPHLKPIIEARLAKMKEFGDGWEERPVSTLVNF